MASVMPDLQLPSEARGMTALWLVPNYTAWCQRHVCMNNLPKVVTREWNRRESNLHPLSHEFMAIIITPPGQWILETFYIIHACIMGLRIGTPAKWDWYKCLLLIKSNFRRSFGYLVKIFTVRLPPPPWTVFWQPWIKCKSGQSIKHGRWGITQLHFDVEEMTLSGLPLEILK